MHNRQTWLKRFSAQQRLKRVIRHLVQLKVGPSWSCLLLSYIAYTAGAPAVSHGSKLPPPLLIQSSVRIRISRNQVNFIIHSSEPSRSVWLNVLERLDHRLHPWNLILYSNICLYPLSHMSVHCRVGMISIASEVSTPKLFSFFFFPSLMAIRRLFLPWTPNIFQRVREVECFFSSPSARRFHLATGVISIVSDSAHQ